MSGETNFKIIAHIKTDFPTKFGIPRQSGLVEKTKGVIIFTPEFRNNEALRGIEEFSHLWLLWNFSESKKSDWSPTVRPPRLGGNKRMGVFATRSPFRPNPIGLSSVKLEKVTKTAEFGTVLEVSGADLLDGTPIYDIKPYLSFCDSHPEATGGFADTVFEKSLNVEIPTEIAQTLSEDLLASLKEILAQDPRPSYHNDAERVYAFEFKDKRIEFKVELDTLTVISIT